MDKVILVGGFHEIIELCEDNGVEIIGIIDSFSSKELYGYPVLGTDENASELFEKYNNIPLIITPDKPSIREKLYKLYSKVGFEFYTLVSNKATISNSAVIGIGSIIQRGANVSSFSKVGDFVKINTNANVMHDSNIENFVSIAPNSVVLGHVSIGAKAYIGANSTILPKINIGEGAIVGAGAVVTNGVKPDMIVVGVPAKPLK